MRRFLLCLALPWVLSCSTGNPPAARLSILAAVPSGMMVDPGLHNRVLENGLITLGMLREVVERWVDKETGRR